jgi:hypothetical protein
VDPGLANLDIGLDSLSGPAGKAVGFAMGEKLIDLGRYASDRIHFYYRAKDTPTNPLPRRIGTVVNSDIADKDVLRAQLLRDCVAAIGIAGGPQSLRELQLAVEAGTPIVPIEASGGSAATAWNGIVDQTWIFEPHPIYDLGDYLQLADAQRAVDAAVSLVRTILDDADS